MVEAIYSVSVPKTSQELEQAIQRYKASDLRGNELFLQWQAIRLAALNQAPSEPTGDRVAGEDSY